MTASSPSEATFSFYPDNQTSLAMQFMLKASFVEIEIIMQEVTVFKLNTMNAGANVFPY